MSNNLQGLSNTKLYRKYRSMLERCNNPNNKSYKDYGGRGITVCEEWAEKDGFLKFYDWAMQNGYNDELTIERKNVNGNYCPSNCCFVTNAEQQRNKRNNVILKNGDKEILEVDLAKELNISESTIRARILSGNDVFAPKFKRTKAVVRDDGVVYESIREAAKANKIHESKIGAVCRGERKRTAGHSFKFKEEAEAKLREMGEK